MKKVILCSVFLLFISSFTFKAQVILNAYAKVTGVTNNSVLAVSNVNETNHTYTVGGSVVVMQMQDDVIGTNTGNNVNFGDLSAIANAGRFEIGIIASRSPASGTPTTITLSTPLANTFNFSPNTSVQIITLRALGINYTTTADITGLVWNGNVGGVVAVAVSGTLTLNHRISANSIGFAGGARSAAAGGGCNSTTYQSNSTLMGFKGEGIYKSTNATYTNARGHLLTGGGGGNEHNGGGGGGGNYAVGGAGGIGYGCGTSVGGIGGISLAASISGNRIFMGGGGGGGGQNNNANSDGGRGGGIVFVKATTLATSTVCGSSIMISAAGTSAANIGNDGAGGGGAAGSIIMSVTNYSVTAACPMTVSANGGDGGDCNDGTTHAGGGGGSQGVVIYSGIQPTVNITTQTANGTGGTNNSGGTSSAGTPTTSSSAGVIPSVSTPLPVDLASFDGSVVDIKSVQLSWLTLSEKNSKSFNIERSDDGINFTTIAAIDAAGNSRFARKYSFRDDAPHDGINYYRLRQIDLDDTFTFSQVIAVHLKPELKIDVFPNPAHEGESFYINIQNFGSSSIKVSLLDLRGQLVAQNVIHAQSEKHTFRLDTEKIKAGLYLIKVEGDFLTSYSKLVVD